MMNEIIDNDELGRTKNNFVTRIWNHHKSLIPLIVVSFFALNTVVSVIVLEGWQFSWEQYGGFLLLGLCWFSYFGLRRYFKFVLILFVALGLFFVINVNQEVYSVSFLMVTVQPLFFLVALTYYAFNFKSINDRIMPKGNNASPEEAKHIYHQQEIEKYKQKFASYSKEQLEAIVEKESSVKAAKEAAQWLLGDG